MINPKKIGVVYDRNALYSASNPAFISKFCDRVNHHGGMSVILSASDLDNVGFFNGIFLRDTTDVTNYCLQFSQRAQSLGIKVIDSPQAIAIGCNKIWQIEQFRKYGIPHPQSYFISKFGYLKIKLKLDFPVVVKEPNSTFSRGVHLARNMREYKRIIARLIEENPMLIVQEFIKTDFDWRIGIFNKQILYTCKYYHVPDDWRILKYDHDGNFRDGASETMNEVPLNVYHIVAGCMKFLDHGLYGIDLKETVDGIYCLEINDNPTIDSGIEDEKEGVHLYDSLVKWFLDL